VDGTIEIRMTHEIPKYDFCHTLGDDRRDSFRITNSTCASPFLQLSPGRLSRRFRLGDKIRGVRILFRFIGGRQLAEKFVSGDEATGRTISRDRTLVTLQRARGRKGREHVAARDRSKHDGRCEGWLKEPGSRGGRRDARNLTWQRYCRNEISDVRHT